MKRRDVVLGIFSLSLALPLSSFPQQQGKVFRIGFLGVGSRPANGLPPAALRDSLAAVGYVEGRNVVYEGRWAEGKFALLPALAAELVRARVDIMVVVGAGAEAAKQVTASIPIVIAAGADAVATGVVANLSRPGGNVTGMTEPGVELSAKRLEILKELMPNAARIAVLWNADNPAMTLRYQKVNTAAGALRVDVQPFGVREPQDFDAAFSAMTRTRPDALFLVADALTTSNRKRVIDFAAAQRIPSMYELESVVQDGGLISYGPKPEDNFRRVAYYIDRILKGVKPGDLPMEQPTRYYLAVNLRTAKALGIAITQSILLRADKVIE